MYVHMYVYMYVYVKLILCLIDASNDRCWKIKTKNKIFVAKIAFANKILQANKRKTITKKKTKTQLQTTSKYVHICMCVHNINFFMPDVIYKHKQK